MSIDLPSPESIVEHALSIYSELCHTRFLEIATALEAPTKDLLQSPLSAKIALLGYNDGRYFYHHELRNYIPLPSTLGPEKTVWKHASLLPVWEEGIRTTPKYLSFYLDSILPPFHPNHRRKWRPHELLHTQTRFYHHPEANRFQMYIGARISELLPVIHWYHLDEILRPRCPIHTGKTLYQEHCPHCEALVTHFWEHEPTEQLLDIAIQKASTAVAHLRQEIHAIQEEIHSGIPVTTTWGTLNASSDAVGYLHGHWNRTNSVAYRYYVEHFLLEGVDYHCSPQDLLDHNIQLALTLFEHFPSPTLNRQRTRLRRRIQDSAARIYQILNWVDDEVFLSIHASMQPLQEYTRTLLETDVDEQRVNEALQAVWKRLEGIEIQDQEQRFQTGYPVLNIEDLQTGIATAFPESWHRYPLSEEDIRTFVRSDIFLHPVSLHQRVPRWLEQHVDALIFSHYQLEAFVRQGPHSDQYFDLFHILPEPQDLPNGRIRTNTTMNTGLFPPEVIQTYLGWSDVEGEVLLCRNYVHGELAVFPLDEELSQLLQDPSSGDPTLICEAIAAGLFVFIPSEAES